MVALLYLQKARVTLSYSYYLQGSRKVESSSDPLIYL